MQHEDVDLGPPCNGVDRGRTGVAGGRADDRQVAIRPRKEFLEQQPEKLQRHVRSEEHTSELQSLMRISYAVFCLKKKKKTNHTQRVRSLKKNQEQKNH